MKKHVKIKRTISVKQFITEFGEDFSKHMKDKLLELGTRCILTRKEDINILDLKHVEHTKYDCSGNPQDAADKCRKEYAYGQFIMNEKSLYFSENCMEDSTVMKAPIVDRIFDSLDGETVVINEGTESKKVDDSNIDEVINSILEVCPEVSAEHMAIISKYR